MNYPSVPQLRNQAISSTRPHLTLREGQMFHGHIKQLFPGQMAEVQIGGQKLMAKLEVPMKAGDAYYFQVKAVTPELQIKIVSGPLQASDGQSRQLSNLMESMQLPKSLEMDIVLNHFLKQKLPVTKEVLLEAVQLLKTVQPTSHNDALRTIQNLIEMKLPLTRNNFTSIFGVETREGLHDLLNMLKDALNRDTGIPTGRKEQILSSMSDAGRMTASAAERALFSSSMLQLLDETVPNEERFQLMRLVKNSGVLPSHTTLANLQSMLHSELIESATGPIRQLDNGIPTLEARPVSPSNHTQLTADTLMEAWKSILRAGSSGNSNSLDVMLSQLKDLLKNDTVLLQPTKLQLIGLVEELERNPLAEIRTSPVGEQISKMMIKMVIEQNHSMPFRAEMATSLPTILQPESLTTRLPGLYLAMDQSPSPVAKDLIHNAQITVEQAIDGKVIKEAMQSLFKSLGFNYEVELLHKNPDFSKTMEMLKPQLVSLLHDSTVSPALRDAAESIVTRMNGPLIQSSDSGTNQQIVMQLPLELLGKRIDTTIHWSGRKKNDGTIDADFARILFYLDLASIKETVVDMQIQDRVVSVTVFNKDDQLRGIGSVLQKKLRDGLESIDYRLSGVTFKGFEEDEKKGLARQNEKMAEHSGVDFRI